jgi:hypothetical protein
MPGVLLPHPLAFHAAGPAAFDRWSFRSSPSRGLPWPATRGWASDSMNPWLRRRSEVDRLQQEIRLLREEIRIKDARMQHLEPQKRPHNPPTERLAILELRAARSWSLAQTERCIRTLKTECTRRLITVPYGLAAFSGAGASLPLTTESSHRTSAAPTRRLAVRLTGRFEASLREPSTWFARVSETTPPTCRRPSPEAPGCDRD